MAKSKQEEKSAGGGMSSEPAGNSKSANPADSKSGEKSKRRRKRTAAAKNSKSASPQKPEKETPSGKEPKQLATSDRLEALEAHIIQRINKLEAEAEPESSTEDPEASGSDEAPRSTTLRKYRFGEATVDLQDTPETSRRFHNQFEATNEVLHELQEMNAALTSAIQSIHFRLSHIEEKLGVTEDDEPGSSRAVSVEIKDGLDQLVERENQLTQQLDRGFKLLGNLYLDSRQFLNRNLLNLGILLIIIVAIAGMLLTNTLYSLKNHLSDRMDGLTLEVRALSEDADKK